MAFQFPIDCLNGIIECLEKDEISLRSCLLVNRLWCKVAVRILWKDIWNTRYSLGGKLSRPYRAHVPFSILSTLISCLSNESKTLLYENGVSITTPTPNLPLFNYISFIKTLLLYKIK